MKKIIVVILICCGFHTQMKAADSDTLNHWFISTNVLSPVAGLNKTSTAANVLVPLVSNLEYGFTLSGGYVRKYDAFEARVTYGRSNAYNHIPQMQLGYNYFVIDRLKENNSGWYAGFFLRYWIYQNEYTVVNLSNISSNLTIGKQWEIHRFFIDARLNQPLTLYSSSDMEHTESAFAFSFSPMPEFSPVLPFLSLNIGYAFK